MSKRHVVDELLKQLSNEFGSLYVENESLRQRLGEPGRCLSSSQEGPLQKVGSDEAVWKQPVVDFDIPGTSAIEYAVFQAQPGPGAESKPQSPGEEAHLPVPIKSTSRPKLATSFTRACDQTQYAKKCAFDDSEEMKAEVRKLNQNNSGAMLVTRRNISFIEDSRFTKIVQSKVFEMLTLLIIVINAIWIAVDADQNGAVVLSDADWQFQFAEHTFVTFFLVELTLRFLAAKEKCSAWRDPWFVFDSLLVGMMVLETWIMTIVIAAIGGSEALPLSGLSILRLFRLVRLTRITRLMRSVPELLFMLKGLLEACRSVAVTLTLLLSILYIFSIALRLLSADTAMGKKYFGSVPDGMFTLLFAGTFLDNATIVVKEIGRERMICAIVFGMNIVLAAFTMVNMLVGVIVEVVSSVAQVERESLAVSFVVNNVEMALLEMDDDLDGCISKHEFQMILEHPKAIKALESVGVDVFALVDFADFIFQSDAYGKEFDKQVDFDEFMEIILKLRGDQGATVKHIIDLQKWIHMQNTNRNMELLKMTHRQQDICKRLELVTGQTQNLS